MRWDWKMNRRSFFKNSTTAILAAFIPAKVLAKEAKVFEKEEFFKDAIKLRKFDEAAKKTGVKIKDIIHYKDLLKASLK